MRQRIKIFQRDGFTILEVLVASAVLIMLLGIMLGVVDSVRNTQRRSMAQIKAFREGRLALDVVSTALSQATLNTYLDYVDSSGNYRFRTGGNATTFTPASYRRTSELRIRSGNLPEVQGTSNSRPTHSIFFQAPLGLVGSNATAAYGGLENLLNSVGFFIEFGDDSQSLPDFFPLSKKRYRYRLMQAIQPSENFSVYKYTSGNPAYSGSQWVTDTLGSQKRLVAENIVALVILPRLGASDQTNYASVGALAPSYLYDSTQTSSDALLNPYAQLPPVVEITVVAVDEKSYARVQGNSSTPLNDELGLTLLFTTVGDVTNPANAGYAKDLKTLGDSLVQKGIDFRVFKLAVPIKSARWSRDQKN